MYFSPRDKPEKQKIKCKVPGCNSNNQIDTRLRFHRVPKIGNETLKIINSKNDFETIDKGTEWMRTLNIQNELNRKGPMYICSLHFKKEDYVLPDIESSRRLLKKTAIPMRNIDRTTNRIPKKKKSLEAASSSKTMIDEDISILAKQYCKKIKLSEPEFHDNDLNIHTQKSEFDYEEIEYPEFKQEPKFNEENPEFVSEDIEINEEKPSISCEEPQSYEEKPDILCEAPEFREEKQEFPYKEPEFYDCEPKSHNMKTQFYNEDCKIEARIVTNKKIAIATNLLPKNKINLKKWVSLLPNEISFNILVS